MRLFLCSVVLVGLAAACSSSSDEPRADDEVDIDDGGSRGDAQTERSDAATNAGSDASEADAGGRDAEFTHTALCTANWLDHDVSKLFRFAVEYAEKPKLPNGSETAMLWWTPLRSNTTTLRADSTVGGTFGVAQETVLDSMDAPVGDVGLPASATPDGAALLLNTVDMNTMPPTTRAFCGTLLAEATDPSKEIRDGGRGPYLRCLIVPTSKGQPLPTVTADDYTSAACASAGSWPAAW